MNCFGGSPVDPPKQFPKNGLPILADRDILIIMNYQPFLNKNVPIEKLMASSALADFVLPAVDSALIAKNPQYLEKIAAGTVITMKKSSFPSDILFDCPDSKKVGICFAELLWIAHGSGMDTSEVAKLWGFDADFLPDVTYLLHAIYTWKPDSLFIKDLPRRSSDDLTGERHRRFRDEQMALFVEQVARTGHVVKNSEMEFKSLGNHYRELQMTFTTYYTCKFQMKSLQENMKLVVEESKTNPVIASILKANKIPQLMSHGWNMTAEEKKVLQGIKNSEGMVLEELNNLARPNPGNHPLPPPVQEQEKQGILGRIVRRFNK